MDRNNSRYSTSFRRQERQHSHHNQQHQQPPPSSAASSTSSAYSSASSTTSSTASSVSHDELIRFIREAWNKVSEQATVMNCDESDQRLKNFEPFNLEEFWGQRFVQNIQISQGQQ